MTEPTAHEEEANEAAWQRFTDAEQAAELATTIERATSALYLRRLGYRSQITAGPARDAYAAALAAFGDAELALQTAARAMTALVAEEQAPTHTTAETVLGWVGVARSGSGLVTFGPFETEEEAETAAAPTAPDPLFLELLQEDPEDDHGSAAWSAAKGWHDVTEPERAAMSASVARNIANKTGRVVYLNDPTN